MITSVNFINESKYKNYDIFHGIESNNISSVSSINKIGNRNLNELDKLANLNKMQISFSGYEKNEKKYLKHDLDNYSGCLAGIAIGDALGSPVKYESIDQIRETYGLKGITDLVLDRGKARISEDTQLTMFTADGLIKSALQQKNADDMPDLKYVYDAYLDWYLTQNEKFEPSKKGWISNIENLYRKRGYRLACYKALGKGKAGTMYMPVNSSKDADGVMRTAPIGLKYYKTPAIAFRLGADCAALTNGSPAAYLSAGLYSAIIANIIQGKDIRTAVDDSLKILKFYNNSEDIEKLVDTAKKLADSHLIPRTAIKKIGAGWNADEAIAIGIYSALKFPEDYSKAVITAVNHSGNSNTTGGIAGGLTGAYLGIKQIPYDWKKKTELVSEVNEISQDLYSDISDIQNLDKRYPLPDAKPIERGFFD